MNLHEYQAKALFKDYGIPVPVGMVVEQGGTAAAAAVVARLGTGSWVVKAQVHAGGRGKAGGVRRVADPSALEKAISDMLGARLITAQSGATGLPINQVLVENTAAFVQELYLSVLVDRKQQRVVFVASPIGGMDIEQVATQQPEQIFTLVVDPIVGVMPYQCRQLVFALRLAPEVLKPFSQIVNALYRLFVEQDLSLIEINPLALTADHQLLALDAKINVDDNGLFRRPKLQAMRDSTQEDPRESAALRQELNYVSLKGYIGCMVNGAGLAMATMDLIKLHGGEPANFLDVGGGITVERVVEAFKLIISDTQVKAILINIFGGIVRCDLIADGIIQAMKQVEVAIPVVARLEGTNREKGRQMLADSGLAIITAEGLTDAARKVIKAANVNIDEDAG